MLVCSPYKFFGPHLGILAARRELLESLTPYKLVPAPDEAPERWETGTQNHEGLAGLAAAVGYLADVAGATDGTRRDRLSASYDAIAAHERVLADRFLAGVAELPPRPALGDRGSDATRGANPDVRDPCRRRAPRGHGERLAASGIFVWDGDYYAREIMTRLGLLDSGGAVRVGFCHYHTVDEVDRVLEALASLP